MTPTRKSLLALAAIVLLVGCQHVAQADPLVLSLENNSLPGVAGGNVTFLGSAENTGATNSDRIGTLNFSPPLQNWIFVFTPFNDNFANQVVVSGTTRGPLGLITIFIPAGTPDGSYSGTLSMNYESIPNINGPLGANPLVTNTVQWTIRVGGPAPVPEPTTMLLLGTGLAGIAAKLKRRKKQL